MDYLEYNTITNHAHYTKVKQIHTKKSTSLAFIKASISELAYITPYTQIHPSYKGILALNNDVSQTELLPKSGWVKINGTHSNRLTCTQVITMTEA